MKHRNFIYFNISVVETQGKRVCFVDHDFEVIQYYGQSLPIPRICDLIFIQKMKSGRKLRVR